MNSIKYIKAQVPFKAFMKRIMPVAMCLTLFVCATVPQVANAAGLWGTLTDLDGTIKGWLIGAANGAFGLYFEVLKQCVGNSYITGTFSNLLGNENLYKIIQSVHSTAVMPVAQSILGLLMLVQLIKISQRIDATSTLPAVKDIVFLVVFFIIFSWLINNSLNITTAAFDIFNSIAKKVGNVGWNGDGLPAVDISVDEAKDKVSIGGCIMLVIIGLLSSLIGLVAYVVVVVVALARVIQLYVMAAFSPIPFSLMGFDETRQAGISFCKSFCSACLAGAIMMFLLVAFPYIVAGITASSHDLQADLILFAGGAWGANAVFTILKFLGVSLLLIVGLIKSGSWAKEIMGA